MKQGNEKSEIKDYAGRLVLRIESEPQLAILSDLFRAFPEAEWFLVGGAVRDIIASRDDSKDFDLLVRKVDLDDLSRFLEDYGSVSLVGRNFGVLKFRGKDFKNYEELDIAWPRTEWAGMTGGYRDFEVQSDPELEVEKDLARRDFTMNAMAWDLRKHCLIDPFGGLSDIKNKTVRSVGKADQRFKEDYSRILRAIRQACQMGFEIEEETWQSVCRLAHHVEDKQKHGRERVVPEETIAKELIKSFEAGAAHAFDLLEKSDILPQIIPELVSSSDTRGILEAFSSSEFQKFFPGEKVDKETVWAAMLSDIGLLEVGRVVRRLRLSSVPGGFDAARVTWLVENMEFPSFVVVEDVKRTLLAEKFLVNPVAGRGLLHLAWVGGVKEPKLKQLIRALKDIEKNLSGDANLISGDDVMKMRNLEAGPDVGRILADLKEAQLQGDVDGTDQARDFVRKYAP